MRDRTTTNQRTRALDEKSLGLYDEYRCQSCGGPIMENDKYVEALALELFSLFPRKKKKGPYITVRLHKICLELEGNH